MYVIYMDNIENNRDFKLLFSESSNTRAHTFIMKYWRVNLYKNIKLIYDIK